MQQAGQLNLAEVLRQWRYGSRLTVREAAKRIGIGYSTLNRIEGGEHPGGETLVQLLTWLFTNAKEVTVRTEEKE